MNGVIIWIRSQKLSPVSQQVWRNKDPSLINGKNHGLVSQQVWHNKDPSMIKDKN
jgi:hypothetical protein